MNRLFTIVGGLFLMASVTAAGQGWGNYVVACGDEDLYIVDAANSVGETPDVIWHWNVFDTYGQVPDKVRGWIKVLDDCKPVNGGKQLLLTSSAGGTMLLDIATRKCLFYARTPMAHSADMLPGGRIAVANSTNPKGNSLEIYDSRVSDVCIWKDTLYSGHGVVWSEKYARLFVLGYKELRMYSLKDWESDKPSLVREKVWELPGNSGHDLNKAGENALTVTNHDGVYLFDITSGKFKPMPGMKGKKNVKSFNYDTASGRVAYTIGETSWWTNHIYLKGFPKSFGVSRGGDKALAFDPAFRLYKVRVLADWDPAVLTSANVWSGAPSLPSVRCEGTTLRIFDDNVWRYDNENVPEAWIPLDVDPRDSVRSIGFAKLVADYAPDIVTLQEYSGHLNKYLGPKLQALGFTNAYEQGDNWNFTPIFYDSTAVQLLKVNYNLYRPATYCDVFTKSYTSAVFRNKSDGKVFALLNTHLWYKQDNVMPGSTMARASQVMLMMAEAELLKSKYECPVFLVGDLNSYENTLPIRLLLDTGYVPCYKAATVFGDNQNGHHLCKVSGYGVESNRPSPFRAEGALDHFFIYNAVGDAKADVLVYYCITDAYTLPLTDHYPNYVDVKL
ncbi:MAG: hypothetical protein IJM41_08535 [Bacteroidales bacterium]|nr:hypothetical protein [Bacteroidales bacterium]